MLLKDKIASKAWELYKTHLEFQLQEVLNGDKADDEEVCPNCALAFAELHTAAYVANETTLLNSVWRLTNEAQEQKQKEEDAR